MMIRFYFLCLLSLKITTLIRAQDSSNGVVVSQASDLTTIRLTSTLPVSEAATLFPGTTQSPQGTGGNGGGSQTPSFVATVTRTTVVTATTRIPGSGVTNSVIQSSVGSVGVITSTAVVQPTSGILTTTDVVQPTSNLLTSTAVVQPTSGILTTTDVVQPTSDLSTSTAVVQPTSDLSTSTAVVQPTSVAFSSQSTVVVTQPSATVTPSTAARDNPVPDATGSTAGNIRPSVGLYNSESSMVQAPGKMVLLFLPFAYLLL
ncbi:hypothetical protein K7432_013750 [Basidiobolus ranarum]|uniref:Uncharacterized protein n=1 Tax=Basidiobolus ranarum TaxID=34480 RepID=A0ABR2VRE7_9FUNG